MNVARLTASLPCGGPLREQSQALELRGPERVGVQTCFRDGTSFIQRASAFVRCVRKSDLLDDRFRPWASAERATALADRGVLRRHNRRACAWPTMAIAGLYDRPDH